MICIKHEYPHQSRVRNEQPVRIINRESNERFEAGFPSIANEVHCLGLGVENENGADVSVGRVDVSLGIDRDSLRPDQLELEVDLAHLERLNARQAQHPALLLFLLFGI